MLVVLSKWINTVNGLDLRVPLDGERKAVFPHLQKQVKIRLFLRRWMQISILDCAIWKDADEHGAFAVLKMKASDRCRDLKGTAALKMP